MSDTPEPGAAAAGTPPINPNSPAPGAAPAAANGAAPAVPAAVAAVPGAGEPAAGGEPHVPGPWGDNWRETAAGDEGKILKELQRYASPKEVAKALVEAKARISSAELAAPLPENATVE